jgi:alpha-D-ribose 1-methylphosphonate 5-triphosphate diphosphatase
MWLTNLRVVLPDRVLEGGSVRLEGELIVELASQPPHRGQIMDGQGMTLIPGIVDIHGDMLERELEPRPGTTFPTELALFELDKRLAANGITTAFAAVALADGPGLRSESRARELISAIHATRSELLVDTLVHARFEIGLPQSVNLIHDCLARDELQLVSLMDHTPGQGQFRDLEHYVEYMTRWLGNREAALSSVRESQERPASWDIGREVARAARERGVAVASHDDDTDTKVRLMHDFGASISEFPVTLEAAQSAKEHGLWVAMGAPNALRGGSHSGNLSAVDGLRAGVVDLLASDYHPASLIQSVLRLHHLEGIPLHTAVALVTDNPAKATGLTDRGRIAPGARADLVFVSAGNTPRVRLTMRQGQVIYSDGRLELNRAAMNPVLGQ